MNCLCIDGLTPLDILSPVFAACSWIKGMHGLMKGPGIQDLPILYIIHFTSDVFLINHKQPLSIAVTLVQVACLYNYFYPSSDRWSNACNVYC